MNLLRARQILELSASDAHQLARIKSAYRRLSRIHHPDRGGEVESMILINQAYAVLSAHLSKGLRKVEIVVATRAKARAKTRAKASKPGAFDWFLVNYLAFCASWLGAYPRRKPPR